jgi:hypothetical protein
MSRVVVSLIAAAALVAAGARVVLAQDAATGQAPGTLHVRILGRVPKPGTIALAPGSRLLDALSAQGLHLRELAANPAGMTVFEAADLTAPCSPISMTRPSVVRPNLAMVMLVRDVDGQRRAYSIDAVRAAREPGSDPALRDGDRIFVPWCGRSMQSLPRDA